jgi:hypothetical protein
MNRKRNKMDGKKWEFSSNNSFKGEGACGWE